MPPLHVLEPDARKPTPSGRLSATSDQILVAAAVFWTLAANGQLIGALLHGRPAGALSTWAFALAVGVGVTALHALLLALVAHRLTVKPLVVVLTVVAVLSSDFIGRYGVVLDPAMLRNVLKTDFAEARELVGSDLLLKLLLYAGLPLLLLSRVTVVRRPWRRAVASRALLIVCAAGVALGAVWSVFQPLAALMRNHRETRYLITPANALWSTGAALAAEARGAATPRQPLAGALRPGASWVSRTRPLVVLLVIGETTRAANWGLAGYGRDTTPQLRTRDVIDLTPVTACGTSTEVSLPCMFAPVGRRDYDETRIRTQESMLHLLARSGVGVHWRDNQSGCKGVCDGLDSDTVDARVAPGLCDGERCLDEGLTLDLTQRLRDARGTQVWVLHMLGSHGPSYFRRYPPTFARFQPACQEDDLQKCSTDAITAAYDNSVLYTDHVLAGAIDRLRAASDRVDSALLFVSDHGESLGEKGLFLHGMPYRIAPREQLEVPMIWWSSPGLARATGLADGCLERALKAAPRPLAHDHLMHSLLGLLDLDGPVRAPSLDLVAPCRAAATR